MKTVALILITQLFIIKLFAQTGTYRFSTETGSWCNIVIKQTNKQLSGNVFVWWADQSGRHGIFSGTGEINNNTCVLTSSNDPDCKVNINFKQGYLNVAFDNCMESNIPEDFSGRYKKISSFTPGKFSVSVDKVHFYKSASTANQLKGYLLKDDMVTVDIENITQASRVFINFKNASGKTTSGYIPWTALTPH